MPIPFPVGAGFGGAVTILIITAIVSLSVWAAAMSRRDTRHPLALLVLSTTSVSLSVIGLMNVALAATGAIRLLAVRVDVAL